MSYDEGLAELQRHIGELASAIIDDRADDVFVHHTPKGDTTLDVFYGIDGAVVSYEELSKLKTSPPIKAGMMKGIKLDFQVASLVGKFAGGYVDPDAGAPLPDEFRIHYRHSTGEVEAEAYVGDIAPKDPERRVLARAWRDEIAAHYPADVTWQRLT